MFLKYNYGKPKYNYDIPTETLYKHIIDLTDTNEELCGCGLIKTGDEKIDCDLSCVHDCDLDNEYIRVILVLNRLGLITDDDELDKRFVEVYYDKEDYIIRLRFKHKEDAAEFKLIYVEWL